MPANATQIMPPRSDEARVVLELRISLIAHRVNARFTQIANKLLSTQGINIYESRILLFLLKRGEMRIGQLVDAMALPQSTMSHQLKQLQARRLIRRRRSRKDNRAVTVTMTPAGEEIARDCERYSVHVQRGLLQNFTAKQIDELTSLLNAVFDFLDVSRFSPDEIDGTRGAPQRAANGGGKQPKRRLLRRAEAM
jgi:MarR family transcriptional regulator, organic hydroperoxide resistance regulator